MLWAQHSEPRRVPGARRARTLFARFAIAWLRFLGRLQPAPERPVPFDAELSSFGEYLRGERGLSHAYIEGRCSTLSQFLGHLNSANGSLQEITVAQIDDALASQITEGGYCRVTVHGCACFLAAPFSSMRRGAAGAAQDWRKQSKDHDGTARKRFPAVHPGTRCGKP